MVSWLLLLATGDAHCGDVVERTLFNVVATSPAEDGQLPSSQLPKARAWGVGVL